MSLCGLWQTANAQTFSIKGRVVDVKGVPIELVTIAVSPSADLTDSTYFNVLATVNTLPNGQFTVSDLAAGDYGLTAFFAGKKLERRVVKIDKVDIMLSIILEDLETSLEEITVDAENQGAFGLKRLRAVERDGIYDAKKNEVVVIDEITANLATNNSRQVYAKVAGLNIWESDGAGIQLGIGGRGLSPNRSSNFNTRQNGYDIAADALGYPESYYTPPVQALQSIEVIRGAASLQYGTQFGGVINFRFREGDADKPFSLTSMQTLGAFGLFNSFNSLGGTAGKINYYAFYQRKQSDGWRPNEGLNQDVVYGALRYAVTPAWSIKGEYTYMSYLAQQPGGLTDTQFADNPRQSNRERNWFAVDWNLFALSSDYALSGRTNLNTRFFALRAGRDALGNLGRIDRIDFGGNRDFISDRFSNWGNETRFIHRYPLLNDFSVLLLGMRYYKGFTDRMQGEGSAENDAVFEYNNPTLLEGSDFDLPNTNFSFFAEKILNMGPKLSFVPGARFEYIRTEAEGYYRNTVRDLAGNILLDEQIDEVRDRTRSFVFFGLGASYKESPSLEFYSNISQNYRAINFNDIRVSVGSLEVDPDIQDERGFNVELGARGASYGLLNYDISLFHLAYKDRIGTVLRSEPNPQFNNLVDRIFRYRTNVADASIYGLELYAEFDVLRPFLKKNNRAGLSLFTNFALIQATYSDSDEPGIEGNDVELVPRYNLKTGVTVTHGNFELAWQIALVDEQFSDATNAARTPTAIEGLIPAYNVMDISSRYTFNRFRLEAGINNLADTRYFTRRATGYPGPGIIPSVGRSWYLSAGVKL